MPHIITQYCSVMNTALSHWWGFAALPENLTYPENGLDNPMTLVCQFAHADGLVYVFADLDYFFGDIDSDGGHIGEWTSNLYQVLYSPSCDNLHEHQIRYPDGTSAVPEARPLDGYDSRVLSKPPHGQTNSRRTIPTTKYLSNLRKTMTSTSASTTAARSSSSSAPKTSKPSGSTASGASYTPTKIIKLHSL